MPHLFTMTQGGDIFDARGVVVAHLSDDSHICDFLSGVRAAYDSIGREIKGEIIRDGDYQAWEAATVARKPIKKEECITCGADCRECQNRI